MRKLGVIIAATAASMLIGGSSVSVLGAGSASAVNRNMPCGGSDCGGDSLYWCYPFEAGSTTYTSLGAFMCVYTGAGPYGYTWEHL